MTAHARALPECPDGTAGWQRWWRQPQRVWVRRALFQVHLWTGLITGLYMLGIGVTGSLLVYRPELYNWLWVRPTVEVQASGILDEDALREAAEATHPGFQVTDVSLARNPDVAAEITLEREDTRRVRVFDPYTGVDLGEAVPWAVKVFQWSLEFHDDLLAGDTGHLVNGVGALSLTLLCLTGFVIWWPGPRRWRRSLWVPFAAGWKHVVWSLHSALGFWTFLFVLMWAFTGVYLVFQQPFMAAVDYFEPFDPESFDPRVGDTILNWFARLHFGRFAGTWMKITWIVLGLAPSVLFVSGAVMWWNRVVAPRVRSGL